MNILTFDIEDWFHILDNKCTKSEIQWNKFDSRIKFGMDYIYEILEYSNVSATFFVVGWMAEKHPAVIKNIVDKEFEIGSHTHLHQLVYEQDKSTFYNDIERSVKTLEDVTGKKVKSFRAPGFSITSKNLWAFEILYELGIRIDSSVFPASRAHGGFPEFANTSPSLLKYNGVELKEFPINTTSMLGKHFVFSGGGYFRLFPYNFIKKWTAKSDYVMSYFHPRDFDFEQPMIPGLSKARQFKSYVGLKGCKPKLDRWLKDFEFIDINEAEKRIDWNKVPQIQLS